MTDTLGAQAPVTPTSQDTQITSLVADLGTTLRAAPELKTAPGLAVPVAQAGGDVTGNAQAVAHTVRANSQARAIKTVTQSTHPGIVGSVLGFLGHVGGDVVSGAEKGLSDVGSVMNKPLQFVQHEYRYLHDVEARHGIWAALGEGAALTLGGVAAAALAPESGGLSTALFAGVLGAEGTTAVAGQVAFHNSWQATTSADYRDPNTHKLVSFGRDVAGALGMKPGQGDYGAVQGIGNALFDLSLDPLVKGGQVAGAARAGMGVIADGNSVVQTVEKSRTLQKTFDDIAGEKSARAIASKLPQFKSLAPELAKATTRDQVTKVFQRELEAENLLGHKLPILSFTALPIEKLRASAVADLPGIRKIVRGQTPIAQVFDKTKMAFTNKNYDPADPASGLAIYHWLRGSGQDHFTADRVANEFMASDDIGIKKEIWMNSVFNAVKAQGMSKMFLGRTNSPEEIAAWADPEFQRKLMGKFNNVTGGATPGRSELYGHGPPGNEVIPGNLTRDGNTVQSAILDSQVGKFSFPSPHAMRDAAAMVAGAKGYYGTVDDFLYDRITYPIFKRWILFTGSFAAHVALAEVVQNALKDGAVNLLRSRAATTMGESGAAAKLYTDAAAKLGVKGSDFLTESKTLAEQSKQLVKSVKKGDLTEHMGAKTNAVNVAASAQRLGVKPADLRQALGDISKAPSSFIAKGYTSLAMRYGGDDAVNSALSDPEEQKAIGAFMYHVLKGRVDDSKRAQTAIKLALYNRGHILAPGVNAGHSMAADDGPIDEYFSSAMRDGARRIHYRGTDDFSSFIPGQEGQTRAWQQWLNTITKDPGSAHAALAYKAALERDVDEPFDASQIPDADMYHGASRGLPNDQVVPDRYGQGSGAGNLFGPGFYTTDNRNVALTYTGKGAKGAEREGGLNRKVYGIKWKGAQPPKMVDLEAPLPSDVKDIISRQFDGVESYHSDLGEQEADRVRQLLASDAKGADIYRAFRNALDGLHKGEADEALHDLNDAIEDAGYDGMRYQGGAYAAKGKGTMHEARMFFDPEKVETTHAITTNPTLRHGLSPEAAHEEGARAATLWLQDHPEQHPLFHASMLPTDGWDNMDPLTAWGHKKMLNVRGATTGIDGTVHHDLLDAIVSGHFRPKGGEPALPNAISRDYLENIDAKPSKTFGREYLPDPTGTMERISNYGHDHVLSPIINTISREPVYLETVHKHWLTLENAVKDGRLSEEDALTKSQTWASQEMIKFVHNIHEKTQLSETLRNYAPFWFAQQQAYKRVGRLLATNPGAFRKYQLIVTQLHDMGNTSKGADGTNYITFPGSGFLSSGSAGLLSTLGMPVTGSSPVSFSGSLDSASFIMPGAGGFRPDLGPLVTLPVKAISMMFPETQPLGNAAIGGIAMNESIWDQLVPNSFVQRVLVAAGASSRSFNSTFMATVQNLDYQQTVAMQKWEKNGSKGPQPDIVPAPTAGPIAQQAFLNKVRNQTRIMYMVRAGLGMFSPLSPQLSVQNFGFGNELTADIAKQGSVPDGVQAFLTKHPDATPYTVFQSTDPTGNQIPASVEAENWINSHQALIAKYPYAAAWLMPQLKDTKYNSSVYNEQIAQGHRVKRTPQEFLTALYVASGNYQYYNLDRPAYEKDLNSGKYDPTTLRSQFSAFTKTLGAQNPIWYDNFQSADAQDRRMQTLDELAAMMSGPNPPTDGVAAGVKGLLQDYTTYQNGIAQKVGTQAELSDSFHDYLIATAKEEPELAPVILSVFGPASSVTGSSFSDAAQKAGVTA